MSICNPCTSTLPILFCSTNIYVGDWIAGAGATVQVNWRNTATGRVDNEEVVTGVGGKVSITFGGKMQTASYEMWINTSTGQLNAQDAFYLPGTTTSVTCITLEFDRANDSGSSLTVAESTIEAA